MQSHTTDAGRLQTASVTGRRREWTRTAIDRRLWTAMAGHYRHQTDAAHRHRHGHHLKILQKNSVGRTSIRTEVP